MVVVRCVLARLGILLVGKSGSVFAERVCFLISSGQKNLPFRISELSYITKSNTLIFAN